MTRWLPVPQLGSLLLAVLGPEAYVRLLIPGTGECYDDDDDLPDAPREQTSRNAVGFEVGNDNKAIRTIWLNASSTTRTMNEVVAGCLTAAINLTGEQMQAQAEWHASVRAKTSIDVLLKKRGKDNPIIGSSPALLQIYPKVLQAVQDPKAHVLVVGETGTGKEVVYELLRLLSPENKPFEIYQLSGARGNDVKSDVFGHVEGAYTGSHGVRQGAVARAEGGTLVLDNAQTYGLDVFADLLRFLQKGQPYRVYGDDEEKHANCRVVVGFNVEPEELEEKEKLPLDWRARFDIRIDVPSLDDRREDIPALVHAFTAKFQRERKLDSVEAIKPPAHQVSLWMSSSWRGSNGNVRGLRGAVRAYCRDRLAAGHSRSTPEPATGDQTVPEPRRRGRPPAVPHEQLFKILDKAAVEQWEYRRLAEALPQDYQDPTKLRRRVRDIGKKEDLEGFDVPKVLAYLDRVLPPACGGAGQKAH